jgi:ABC-type glutathione transport system ATPase component
MTARGEPVVSARDVVVAFQSGRGSGARKVRALDAVSLDIPAGQSVGLVGESGSGKTTLAHVLLGLVRPESGTVHFNGRPMTGHGAAGRRRGRLQVVLQNSDWALNPLLRVRRSVAEPLAVTGTPRRAQRAAVDQMLALVGLDATLAERYPHQLSGGQRQRVAIARAMITHPELIVFDEAVSALDVSVQTQVLNLIRDVQAERGFAALFISHDLAAVRYVSHHLAVMYQGAIVEAGAASRFYTDAQHPYTRELIGQIPVVPNGAAYFGNRNTV